MTAPTSNVDDAPVHLDEGIEIKAGLYRRLTDIRGAEIRRKAEGLPPRSVKEKASEAGIRPESYQYLAPFVEKQAKRLEELQRRRDLRNSHSFEDRMPRGDEPMQIPEHRGPDGRKDWEAVRGYEDTFQEARSLAQEVISELFPPRQSRKAFA